MKPPSPVFKIEDFMVQRPEPADALGTDMEQEALRRGEGMWSSIYDLKLAIAEASGDASSINYARTKRRIRELVRDALPPEARVAVASKGDPDLLDLYGRRTEHFPQDAARIYLDASGLDDTAVIAQLESQRARGVEYLLVPRPSLSWVKRYSRFQNHLDAYYESSVTQEDTGVLYDLRSRHKPEGLPWWRQVEEVLEECRNSTGSTPSILDWHTDLHLRHRFPDCAVVWPRDDGTHLPYPDATIDVVIMDRVDPGRLEEARRIAEVAVVVVGSPIPEASAAIGLREIPLVAIERFAEGGPSLPAVTVVIPTFNGLAHLLPCLRAIGETLPPFFDGKVLIVDDASTDGTGQVIRKLTHRWPWLELVKNRRNKGFVSSCNIGAEASSTEFLVFLNNDTVPQVGWLPPLLRTFRDYPAAGAVGGKLIFPDGRLQEAGCVLFRDGSGANFGRDSFSIGAPIFNYLRPVTYCSGALLATRRDLFLDAGGFDSRFRPAYYEDADYCLTLADRGYSVYYQPESVVVHVEGATGGTDLENGVKRYQAINQGKFVEKWAHVLEDLPAPPDHYDSRVWQELAHVH